MTVVYEKIISDIESLISVYMSNQRILSNTTQVRNLHSLLDAMVLLRRSRDIVTAADIVNKVILLLYFIKYLF